MRYVERPEADMIAAQNELTRTQDYACLEVKKYLSKTYRGICAYCETEVEASNFLEVEHFYPKSQYSSYQLDIHNLHLACKRCNNPKGARIDKILSPNFYLDDPDITQPVWKVCNQQCLGNKIKYRGHLLYSPSNDPIAESTISILRLNNSQATDKRERLIESRLRVYSTALNYLMIIINEIGFLTEFAAEEHKDIYIKIYKHSTNTTIGLSKDALLSMMKHGSMFSQMVIDNFYEPLCQCLEIILAISPSKLKELVPAQINQIQKFIEQTRNIYHESSNNANMLTISRQ